ncbi:MAG: Crp/Fnr family transcriptional regulator [Bacteroidetes bacterium]|nr:MAG: Crp/Fnr family transcriptional regulator [Bacteroidota bacterium]REK05263.1 MAG: Crp/Fnr family transcriptional regulator [Bacteroidota bacterium]REK32668.1 MAG: Crp/Fnr family transcriptional regulator [Bacteroidota bacterium]REK48885.1 MAG: Crp/Fnr family transcriptional regulator [Bacteroidota bacterium]
MQENLRKYYKNRKIAPGIIKTDCMECEMKDCSILKECTDECVKQFSGMKKVYVFKSGQRIFMEGNSMRGIYFVEEGQIKIYKSDAKGQEIILRFAGSGDMIGLSCNTENNEYAASAVSLSDSTLCFADAESFSALYMNHPDLALQLIKYFKSELCTMETRALKLASLSVFRKVADTLLTLLEKFGVEPFSGTLNAVLSRQEMASFAGTTKEQVSKIISELKQDGIIDTNGKLIRVLKPDLLMEMASD